MADYNALEALINAYIKQNGVKAITGQVLNGVLRGMVSALGKGWTIAEGDARPDTDPGTMTGPVAYVAHTAGTYTNFGGLVVNEGEVALLKYNEQTWTKEVLASLAANATIDGNVGTPAVGVSFQNGVLTFDFRNMKGNPGDSAGFGTVNATVDGTIGTPGVSVQSSGPDTAKNFTFAFTGLKGETGVTSVVATVDNTTGNPSCSVSLVGQELHLDFTGLKGAQGDTGVSANYPIAIVNNLTTDDPASALSAAQGVVLAGQVSQLEHEVTELEDEKVDVKIGKNLLDLSSVEPGKFFNINGVISNNDSYSISDFIEVEEGDYCIWGRNSSNVIVPLGTGSACINLYNSSKERVNTITGESAYVSIPSGVSYIRISIINAYTDKMVERGNVISEYEEYNPIGGYLSDVVEKLEGKIETEDDKIESLEQMVIPIDRTGQHQYTGNGIFYFWEDLDIKQGTKFTIRIDGTATWGTNGAWVVSNLGTGLPGLGLAIYGRDLEITAQGDITKIGLRLYNITTQGVVFFHLKVLNQTQDLLSKKVDITPGKNLYNPETNYRGWYFNSSGVISQNIDYSITDFIPVREGKTYSLTGLRNGVVNPIGLSSVKTILYDYKKNPISFITPGTTLLIPSGVSFIRCTIANDLTEIQIEEGGERTEYVEYSPIGGLVSYLPNNSVTMDKLSQGVRDAINAGGGGLFRSSRKSGTLAPGEILRTDLKCHIIKNSLLVAKITGTINKVSVGVGILPGDSPNYQCYWAEIDQTNIKIYWYNNVEDTLVATYTHGMTLTNKTTLWVDTSVGDNQTVKLVLQDDLGNMFTQELTDWGMGVAFVRNDNDSGSLDIELSFMPRDITKKIWFFGDSYFSFVSNAKWTYYLMADNLTDWLSNNLPGLSPSSGFEDLESLLTLGHTPSYLVWCLGMNGATAEEQEGGEYVINPAQKAVIDDVLAVCQQYGITPVLATIPTVPTRQKTGFCNYVRSLGVRYIDFAEAVGATSAGVWNAGLLSYDGVHPTSAGAKVLLTRAMLDFPELSLVD